MPEEIVVFVTCPPDEGEALAKPLVEAGLAACVNVLPSIRSIYMWQNQLNNEEECLLVIKSSRVMFDKLAEKINELHPYEIPEIIALPIELGYKAYLDWLNGALKTG